MYYFFRCKKTNNPETGIHEKKRERGHVFIYENINTGVRSFHSLLWRNVSGKGVIDKGETKIYAQLMAVTWESQRKGNK